MCTKHRTMGPSSSDINPPILHPRHCGMPIIWKPTLELPDFQLYHFYPTLGLCGKSPGYPSPSSLWSVCLCVYVCLPVLKEKFFFQVADDFSEWLFHEIWKVLGQNQSREKVCAGLQISSTLECCVQCSCLQSQYWGGAGRRVSAAGWPVNLAESMRSRFSERPWIKKLEQRRLIAVEEDS